MEHSFQGHVAFVTGGGSGLGFAVARELVARGAHVVIASRNRERLESAVEGLAQDGGRATAVQLDVRSWEDVGQAVDSARQFTGRVDLVVNAAAGNFRTPAECLSPGGWRAVNAIVLDGTWNVLQHTARAAIREGHPLAAVNIASQGGVYGSPTTHHSAAAKAGVVNLTRSLAAAWGPHRIRINCLSPGVIAETPGQVALFPDGNTDEATREIPLGRLGARRDVALAAAFLLSSDAAYITGTNLFIDGGRRLPHL